MRYRRHTGVSLTPLWTIMGVNFLLFLATTVAPQLVFFLGIQPASFLSRPWTIVTSMFVHGGFGHIIVNMLALYFFGSYTLRLLGKVRFQLVYFSGGIMGGLFFVWLGSPLATAVGASGAVFALGGLLAVMQPMLRVFIFPIPVPIPIWVAVIGGFFIISSGVAWSLVWLPAMFSGGFHLEQLNTRIEVLEWLFLTRGVPKYIHSDNGPEFVAKSICNWLPESGY